jgi:hypothetical protein
MKKIDFSKSDKAYFSAAATPTVVTIPKVTYLALGGKGDPSQPDFSKNVEALYSTAYTLKFRYKAQDQDFVVSKLEGMWWYNEKAYKGVSAVAAPTKIPRSAWEYKLLIRMPEFITEEALSVSKEAALKKKGLPAIHRVELLQEKERRVVQILHTGAFETEPVSLQKLFDFIKVNNLRRDGLHHEVYLSDFRKTKPDQLKTILREPVLIG